MEGPNLGQLRMQMRFEGVKIRGVRDLFNAFFFLSFFPSFDHSKGFLFGEVSSFQSLTKSSYSRPWARSPLDSDSKLGRLLLDISTTKVGWGLSARDGNDGRAIFGKARSSIHFA